MSAVEMPKKWDHESDVIVVGGGTAGIPAAIKVAEAGLKATVLETRKMCGGSFRMVWGSTEFACTEEQKEKGIDDSPDLLYDDMVKVAGADPELARAYADNQLEAYRWLKEEGIKFPGLGSLPGNSRPRALGLLTIGNMGVKMSQAIENRARRMGVEILTGHRATRLVTDPTTGKVIGVRVDVEKEKVLKNFKARKAVVIASGGFGRNLEMVAEYAPNMVSCVPVMPPSHMGDGIKMGMAIGAATKDMGIAVAPSWPVDSVTHSNAIRALNFGGIMVNVQGQRFADESYPDSFYGPMSAAAMKQEGGYFVLYDQGVIDHIIKVGEGYAKGGGKDLMLSLEKCKVITADSVEEMAKKTGIDAKGLKQTFDKYNSDIDKTGYDTIFGRKYQKGATPSPIFKLNTPPYYAVKTVTCTTSMKGGLKINGKCQVINQFCEVIPGLYAAGETTGGLWTKTYLLGIMSSASFTQGIIAGKNAIKEPSN